MNKILNIRLAINSVLVVILFIVISISHYNNNQRIENLKRQLDNTQQKNRSINDWKYNYYNSAVATFQSPHGLRLKLDSGDDTFVLVDVRRQDFYEAEHIVTAINISTDRNSEEIYKDFEKIRKENPYKDIIIYCYSTSCLNGKKVGRFLAQKEIFVKELSVGFNEWKNSHQIWNYPGEIYNIEDYLASGLEAGDYTPKTTNKNVSCGEVFAC